MSAPSEPLPGPLSGTARAKRGPNKLLLAAPGIVVALGAGVWLQGSLPQALGLKKSEPPRGDVPAFVEIPEVVTNLNTDPRHPRYVKLKARLETISKDAATVNAALPRLVDLFQTYLRETRPEELQGSLGTYRLRQELIARATLAAAPAKINDVLFSEMLIQ